MVPSILPPLMLAVPLVAAISIALLPAREGGNRTIEAVHVGSGVVVALAALLAVGRVLAGADLSAVGGWFVIDPLAAIFVALIGLVGLLTGLYAVAYVRHDVAHGELTPAKHKLFFAFFQFFVFTMMLAVTSNNIVLTWVAVEATTLGSAFLVGLYGRRSSLEAAWKYVIICTVGVAFGLYGTVLTFADGAAAFGDPEKAVFWTSLTADAARLDPMLAKIAFVFVLIGFGTKAGLFPMHGWLPDAHSEAPSPVSALLSGVLLKCALFVVIRYLAVTSRAVGPEFPQMLLLALGFLSVTVAVFLFLVQKDLKRKLAYSSVEHVGLIAIGLGFGGPLGVGAALLHAINHSFAKSLIFCASGNVLMKYGTRDLTQVKGLLRVAPASGVMVLISALALAGFPPFAVFVSEFLVIGAGFAAGQWLPAIILGLLLTIAVAAFVQIISGSVLGKAPETVPVGDVGWRALAPMWALVAIVVALGVAVPRPVGQLVREATAVVVGGDRGAVIAAPWQKSLEPVAALAPRAEPRI